MLRFFYFYFIVINIILVDVLHGVTTENNSYTIKDTRQIISILKKCYTRIDLTICSLSVALNENDNY